MNAGETTLGGLSLGPGAVVAKKYRLERLIGEGGTGVVVAATHLLLEEVVAIKFLRKALESDELRVRFLREASAIGKIQSDHVVLVLDAGALEDGSPYMVMEHLEGRDLARVLKEDGPLDVEDAVDCMVQVCEALGEAHAAGIVHRDLKPANLFLTRRDDGAPHVKVVDFGISKILDKRLVEGDGGPREMTSAFTVLGSPRYMAPEQLRNSRDVDGRADLWSVGAVLFQLVTGKHAFEAVDNVQASLRVLTAEPARLRDYAPSVPPGLEAAVARCLTKDVDRRFQSARELADALRPFGSERARESLEQRSRVELSNLEVALAPSTTSEPPPRARSLPPPRGLVDVRGGPAAPASDPAPGVRAAAPARALRRAHKELALGIALGLSAAGVVVIGAVLLMTRASAPRAADRLEAAEAPGPAALPLAPTSLGAPAAVVPLDAGRAPP